MFTSWGTNHDSNLALMTVKAAVGRIRGHLDFPASEDALIPSAT